MDLPCTSVKLSFIVFVIAHTLPCFGGYASTMSPGLSQSSTELYRDTEPFCRSPQYFEFGTRAVLNCSFPRVYFGIFWYNASDLSNSKPLPLIYLKPSGKGGHGYASKDYDITDEGSLIITTVNFQHDQNFSAIVFESPTEEYSPNYIRVIVTVRPYQRHPYIEGCNNDERVCFRSVQDHFKVSCTVVDARPNVQLEWFTLTVADYYPLVSTKNVTLQNFLYTTRVEVSNIEIGSKKVAVYLCKSVSIPSLLKYDSSIIVTKGVLERPTNMLTVTKYVQYSAAFYLTCTDEDVLYVVWRKQHPTGSFEDVLDILWIGNTLFPKSYSTDINVTEGHETSLLFSKADIGDEGLYSCIFGDGISEDVKTFNVQVYELSDSPYPFVEGCFHPRHCALFIEREVTLTCVIKGVRPTTNLEWEIVGASHKSFVTFFNHKSRVKRIGLKFEVSLTSDFRIQNLLKGQFAMKCTASNYSDDDQAVSTITHFTPKEDQSINDLITETPKKDTNQQNEDHYQVSNGMWGVSLLAFPLLVVTVIFIHYCKNRRTTERRDSNEIVPLTSQLDHGKISKLKRLLKTTYRNKCEAIQPLPYEKGLIYNIDQIFVESPIERLEKSEMEDQEEGFLNEIEIWKTVTSYNDILRSGSLKHSRVLLEGDAGYGKSTLGLRFAYDWCTEASKSPLKNVDIFILLRMRDLKDISSIPSSVKEFLLPKDSGLTDGEVETILNQCASLVIFLDGFNRFPNQTNYENTVIQDILLSDVLSNSQVIITTRPLCLPKKYPNITKRFRLTGFQEETRNKYMDKVFTDIIVKRKIHKLLGESPLLGDLCQVPLFFVLMAHILNTGTYNTPITLRTVSEFFSILVKSFHAKMKSDTCSNCKHASLSQICFDALINNKEGLLWTKDEICMQLCKALYNEYYTAGILIEEQFRCHTEFDRQYNYNRVRYRTKVRFFHNIFCEWYAACKLSTIIARSTDTEQYLTKINQFDHQYVFRFSCGMNTAASGKIVKYLQGLKGCNKLAVLCYVEQSFSRNPVDETLKKMFSSPVIITPHDTLFLHSWTIELLEIAAADSVDIECIWLGSMGILVDFPNAAFKLKSGIVFPKLATLNQLSIREPGRIFTEMDIKGLVAYADRCSSLKSIRFRACLLPFFIQLKDDESNQDDESDKRVAVEWKHSNAGDWYRLNFQSGKWECDSYIMTNEEYEQIKESVIAEQYVSSSNQSIAVFPRC
ncbi:NACHT, LRR and PYD domains-containing protein 10 [Holothuria leucospilota]|uniref:NACHT, LRR and PYD domains-containing protein 10 n=1 Tax=Holothuria leucospilota TaxID=206669 RepID=A0A9Q1HJZ6_HOLLE|nr:NACHT, LRR and PYD domains-containing protein 10 [Holothuria leucospilota]